jgi:glycosyltransferase involved in cell wall biosynthesis
VTGVTLLLPTYERAPLLANSLRRLATLTVPDEVIVVDDGGTDDTEAVCKEFGARYARTDRPSGVPSRARNVGLALATHDLILTTDPEVIFETDLIAQYLRLVPTDVILCTGFYVHLYHRDWLLEVGGWDESFPEPWGWEDCDLHARLDYLGHPENEVPDTRVTHQWHEPRSGPSPLNEEHCRSKVFPRDLVANA